MNPPRLPLSPQPLALLRAAAMIACLAFSGCATTAKTSGNDAASLPSADSSDTANDPFEPFNRAMYKFNDKLDRYVLKPVAKGYRAVVPAPARQGVSNFFSNLFEPMVALNDALQGKFKHAGSDLGRFATNSTLGLFGIFDVATRFGIERHREDLGQTLGVWGVKEGPYLVLPIWGPSTVRDGFGLIGDVYSYPVTYLEDSSTAWSLYGVQLIDTRAQLLDVGDIVEQAAGEDPYVFVREAYRQRRRNLIADGAAPTEVDPSIFEDEPAKAPPERPAPPSLEWLPHL